MPWLKIRWPILSLLFDEQWGPNGALFHASIVKGSPTWFFAFVNGVHLPSKLPAIHLQRAFTGAGHVCFFSFLFSLPLSFKIICIYFLVSSSDWANLIAIDCSISRKALKIWIAISSLGSVDTGHNFCIWCRYDISNLRHHLLKKICFLQSLLCWSNISSLKCIIQKEKKNKNNGGGDMKCCFLFWSLCNSFQIVIPTMPIYIYKDKLVAKLEYLDFCPIKHQIFIINICLDAAIVMTNWSHTSCTGFGFPHPNT